MKFFGRAVRQIVLWNYKLDSMDMVLRYIIGSVLLLTFILTLPLKLFSTIVSIWIIIRFSFIVRWLDKLEIKLQQKGF